MPFRAAFRAVRNPSQRTLTRLVSCATVRFPAVLFSVPLTVACGGDESGSGTTSNASSTSNAGPTTTQAASSGGPTGGAEVSYAADVAPIFDERCTDCHHQGVTAIPNIADPFDPTNGLIAFPNTWHEGHPETPEMNVVPGDPDNSFLVHKIAEPTPAAGAAMPWSPDRLTATELADLRQWVMQGALDDAFYQSNIRRIFGNPGALGPPGGKCVYCHYPAGVAPDLSNPFDPMNGAVNVAATAEGWTRVIPGDPDNSLLIVLVSATETIEARDPMPKVYPRLTADEVQIVTQWILEGARDN